MKELIVALTSHLIPDPAPISPTLWRTLRPIVETGEDVGVWAGKHLAPADAEKVSARLNVIDQAAEEIENLEALGVRVLTEFDAEYPARYKERLKGKHPAVLFVSGSITLLNQPMIGIVGSREVDEDGAEFARTVASQAIREGFGVVSGGARGVDQVAMKAAYDTDGGSIGILADALVKTVKQPSTRAALESGSVCLCTPFSPYAPFSVGNAMGRNKLIYALSDATVVVASSDGSGGTWAGAVEALDQSLCRVLVRDISLSGNQKLIAKGGVAIASATELLNAMSEAHEAQAALF